VWAALRTLDACEGRTVAEPAPGLRALPHAVFLERMAGARKASSSEARLGRAAFVALRLVDLLTHDRQALHAGAFHYQHVATERACRDLPANRTETTHLVGLVRSTAEAFQAGDNSLALPALFAYAYCLEDELRLDEALDVLETTLHVGGEALRPPDRIAIRLRTARVLRKQNQFETADAAYATALRTAHAAGDHRSAFLSRLGAALVTQARGNLSLAELLLREILADLDRQSYPDLEGATRHALGTTLLLRGQIPDALGEVWRAFELYEDESSRLRALNDTGVMLLALGRVEDAERALTEVVRYGGARDNVSNALIELMHCASYRRDRMAFERRRAECEARAQDMPPNILADFRLKAGIGTARFGNLRKAGALLAAALDVAERGGLHEFEFRIERIMAGLDDCEPEIALSELAAAEPATTSQQLEAVCASVARLGCDAVSDKRLGC